MKQKTEIVAVVPAAGVGSRMQSTFPKQYQVIHEQTVLEHSVYALLKHAKVAHVVVVISPEDSYFGKTSLASHPKVSHCFGGKERADSVLAGLKATTAQWVMVHDAARPCLQLSDIDKLIEAAFEQKEGAILAMLAKDTIKKASGNTIVETIDRQHIWQALTPQMFKREALIAALEDAKSKQKIVTDDASAIELMGGSPRLVQGRGDNIKITLPEDLVLAEFFLAQKKE